MTFKQRLKAAFRTNEPQAMTVMTLTGATLALVAGHAEPPPLALWAVSLLFWPTLALLANLAAPLPEDKH